MPLGGKERIMKDQSIGFRSLLKKQKDGGRVACRNGNLCQWYMAKRAPIHSLACPYECEFYIPITANVVERK